jgi:hypothetical protein
MKTSKSIRKPGQCIFINILGRNDGRVIRFMFEFIIDKNKENKVKN